MHQFSVFFGPVTKINLEKIYIKSQSLKGPSIIITTGKKLQQEDVRKDLKTVVNDGKKEVNHVMNIKQNYWVCKSNKYFLQFFLKVLRDMPDVLIILATSLNFLLV